MSKSGSYSCKSCRQNPIFRSFLLKNFFQKKIFCSKKIKKSKLTNFRFQLDWKPGFRVRDKNCKIEKAGRTWLQGSSSTCLLVVPAIHRRQVEVNFYLPSSCVCHSQMELLQLKVHLSLNPCILKKNCINKKYILYLCHPVQLNKSLYKSNLQ